MGDGQILHGKRYRRQTAGTLYFIQANNSKLEENNNGDVRQILIIDEDDIRKLTNLLGR